MTAKLDAVNQCLEAISESAVASLSTGLPDADEAERILDRVSTDVQAKGWHCNTDEEVELTPDVDGYIILASTMKKVDTVGRHKHINVVPRRDPNDNLWKLFNVSDQTFEFDDALLVDIIYEYEFDNLTFELQRYIAAKAAAQFQMSVLKSAVLDRHLNDQIEEAWAALQDAEGETEDYNILTDSAYVREVVRRNHSLYGR